LSDERDTPAWCRRLALAVGLAFSLVLVALHLRYIAHAGPLWRDEVNSVNVASLPTLRDVYAHVHLESFPVAWCIVEHLWIRAGLGATDEGLRRLGLVIGLGTLALLWWAARRLGVRVPLVTLLVLGASPSLIIYGDQARGYGLGALAIAWTMGAMWAFVERPGVLRYLNAQAAALLAAQTYFGNSFLLVAICAAATACAVRRRAWRLVLAVGAIGAIAAISMLVNLPSVRYAMNLSPIEQYAYPLGWYAAMLNAALAPDVPVLGMAWKAALGLAAAGCALAWWRADADEDRERALFVVVAATGAVVVYGAYLSFIKVRTDYWYYLPLMTLGALACEVGVALLLERVRLGLAACAVVVALTAAAALPQVYSTVALRMTDVDVAAAEIERSARPDDLVVVMPWYCGITFARYYRGPAPWITLPDFAEHRFHLHGEVAEKMKRGSDGVAPELERVAQTLARGGRIWVVGAPRAPKPGETVPMLPAAPNGPQGWRAAPYLDAWELAFGALLRDRGRTISGIALPDVGKVNVNESLPLVLVES
jgi:hypothetical protein